MGKKIRDKIFHVQKIRNIVDPMIIIVNFGANDLCPTLNAQPLQDPMFRVRKMQKFIIISKPTIESFGCFDNSF